VFEDRALENVQAHLRRLRFEQLLRERLRGAPPQLVERHAQIP
jgi:hypothetical protein